MLVFVCVCVCVRLCMCPIPISDYNFVKCEPILIKLDMQVAGSDTCNVEKYHANRSKCHQNCEKHVIVDNSGTNTAKFWCHNILDTKANRNRI